MTRTPGSSSLRYRATAMLPVVLLLLPTLACAARPDEDAGAATIRADDLARLVRTISSDEFGGRGPASHGEEVTLEFLGNEFERIGLQPMGDEQPDGTRSWLQRVPAVEITADPATARLLVPRTPGDVRRGRLQPLRYGEDFVAWTLHQEPTIDVTAPLVFVGYGVVAPEEDWNDYKVDVAGKIVVMLVNDPPVPGKFGDEAMTYYGRWTYKFEEAARRGAAGALLVHETDAAGYGWEVVRSSWTGPQFSLPIATDQPPPAAFEGWLSQRAAATLFTAAGLNLAEMVTAAADPTFQPVELGFAATLHLDNDFRAVSSYNVVGGLPGRDADAGAEEWLLWTAHWDHFGEDSSLEGDTIYNGALDNATGVAALLELAEAFASLEPHTRRSHLFIATTLEEQGLLGSAYYASHPIVPPAQTVAAFNIDGLNVWGVTDDVTVVGLGNSELEDLLAEVLREQGRSITPDPEPEKGFYYRSDHFPLAKVGVPALYLDTGVHFVGKPEGFAQQVRDQYTELNYHRPSDEFDPSWDFAGAELDVRTLYRVAFRLAESDAWPNWYEGSEFRAVREASRAAS